MFQHTCSYQTKLDDHDYLNHILTDHGIGYNKEWKIICHWNGLETTACSAASLVKHLREKYLVHTAPIGQSQPLYAQRRTLTTAPVVINDYPFPSFTYREEPSRRETTMRHMRPQIVDWFKYLQKDWPRPSWAGPTPHGGAKEANL